MTPESADRTRVIDEVSISTQLDPWLSLRAAAAYTDLSIRTLRKRLTDRDHPLPCSRPGGKILLRRSELDRWITKFRQAGNSQSSDALDKIVDSVLRDLNSKT